MKYFGRIALSLFTASFTWLFTYMIAVIADAALFGTTFLEPTRLWVKVFSVLCAIGCAIVVFSED